MKTSKTIISLTLIAVLVLGTMAGCSTKNDAPAAADTNVAAPADDAASDTAEPGVLTASVPGGWSFDIATTSVLPEDVQAAFDKALSAYTGMTFEPVAYLGSQLVAGMNYAILCKSTTVTLEPVTELKVVIIYADLDGNAEITHVNDFSIADYNSGITSFDTTAEPMVGAWAVSSEPAPELPEDFADTFTSAFADFTGSTVEPLAAVGTQVVAGMNYAYVCRSTTVTLDPVTSLAVVIIYKDLEGKTTITSFDALDIAKYNQ